MKPLSVQICHVCPFSTLDRALVQCPGSKVTTFAVSAKLEIIALETACKEKVSSS